VGGLADQIGAPGALAIAGLISGSTVGALLLLRTSLRSA
jgi:hypothetical protein